MSLSCATRGDAELEPTSLPNKAFQDTNGLPGRAEDQAFQFAQFIGATIFENEKAKQYCNANAIAIQKAQAESNAPGGGVIVPDAYLSTVIRLVEQAGVFRKGVNRNADSDVPLNVRYSG
jgi:hypothetical protein